jgi:peptide/nickel transport system permease protein
MLRYVAQRLLTALVTMFLLTLVIFGITQVLPGDVARMIMGQYYDPLALASLREQLGLNDPLHVQYLRWLTSALHADFGQSLVMKIPVGPLVFQAAGRSALLAVPAVGLTALVGISFGVIGAVKRETFVDYITSIISFLGISVPEFVTGMLLIIVFSAYLHLLPSSGYVSPLHDPAGWLAHSIMPVATLVLAFMAHVARLTRSGMLEVLQSNFVRNARARGISELAVMTNHALPSALLPTITVLALAIGAMIGDIVVVETVFSYPGLGQLLVRSIQRRDLPVIQACILIASAAYIIANLVADLLYAWLDPRIRYTGETG